jgi:large subunit ribosomal protein L30
MDGRRSVPRLRITYKKSAIGYPQRQKETIRSLGFHKLYSTLEKDDTPSVRGMIQRVAHLVTVEEIADASGVAVAGEET